MAVQGRGRAAHGEDLIGVSITCTTSAGGTSVRRFAYSRPSRYSASVPIPINFVYHGATNTPEAFAGTTAMHKKSRYVLTIYPGGCDRIGISQNTDYLNGGNWNDGSNLVSITGSGDGWPARQLIDDLAFYDAMKAWAEANFTTSGKVCVFGNSKGGMMAYHIATRRQITALGVGAAKLNNDFSLAAGITAAPLIHCHGDSDTNVNYSLSGSVGYVWWAARQADSELQIYAGMDHTYTAATTTHWLRWFDTH